MSNDTEAAGLRRSTAHQFAVSKVEIFRAKKTCQYTTLFDLHNCSSETGPNQTHSISQQLKVVYLQMQPKTVHMALMEGLVNHYKTKIAREF